MKKNDILAILVYVLMLVIAFIYIFIFVRDYSSKSGMDTGIYILFNLGAMFAGLIFNATLFEIAHILGAKIGGYNIVSVCILGLTFYRAEKSYKVKFSSYDGLTGETKITPNPKRKKYNPIPYLIMGTILYGIEIFLAIFTFSLINSMTQETPNVPLTNLAYFILTFSVIGGILLVYNILPVHLDSLTDGYRLLLISGKKRKETKLFGEDLVGKEQEEVEEVEVKPIYSDNPKLNEVYELLNEDKFVEAEVIIDEIMKNTDDLTGKFGVDVSAHKVFLHVMNNDLEAANEFYTKEVPLSLRKQISEAGDLVTIRSYVLMAGLLDKSKYECYYVLKKAYKAYQRINPAIKSIEVKLYNLALDKVIEVHSDWELETYKILTENK